MTDWSLAFVAVSLVALVLGLAVRSANGAVESRVLVIGFLAFFLLSLIAGAGLLPLSPRDEATSARLESAVVR